VKLALDTNAYRALHEGDLALARRVRFAEMVALPIVVIAELRFGLQNGTRLEQSEEQIERFLRTHRVQVLQVTLATTWMYGEVATLLRARGVNLQQNDIWIAALCKQYAFRLATRDRGFQSVIGLQVAEF